MQGTMGKGALEIAGFASIYSQEKWIKKQQEELLLINNNFFVEPTSVLLHMRRSQSPPTSASTLSSSFNGGGGGGGGGGNNSTDNTTTATATIATEPTTTTTTTIHHHLPHLVNESRKEDWSTELQPIPSGLEIVSTTTGGGERCGLGGLEDWDSMLSESAASPSQEQSFLRWIAGDVDDTSFGLKQLLQSGNSSLDFDGNAAGLGIVDQGGPGFEPISGSGSGITGAGNLIAAPNLVGFHGSGFVTNNNGNGKIGSIGTITPSSSSGLVNYKVGLNSINNNNTNCNIQNPMFTSPPNNLPLPVSLPMIYHHQQQQSHQFVETPEEKPHIIMNPQQQQQQQQQSQHHPQNPNFFLPLPFAQQEQQHQLLQHQLKRHNSGTLDPTTQIPKLPFSDPSHEFLLRKQMGFPQGVQFLHQQKPMMIPKQEMAAAQQQQQQQQQQHTLLDQLYKAAELIGTGNFSHAQAILARLNHQLSPVGKPLIRAAFYFKEALQLLLLMNNPVTSPPPRSPTPFDVFFKMGAYKVFSEVSPLIQFVNFTCNQALLEALDDADRIHIVDFDIGFGAQWASFMQELPMRSRGAPSLRITAFASPSTHHPVELGLMRENLTQFANEIGVTFELDVVNFDSLDQTNYSLPLFRSNENEAVAVNFPIWSSSSQPYALPSLLRFVKQLSPKIVVSLDRGCDRSDLPFPQHIVHALQSYINLLESLDAVNVTSDAVNKIERFLLQPRIESTVLGRLRAPDKMPLWKTLFASSGFSPVMFSNFTEAQAECVVKRTPVRGFHVEKRQASLVLCWQRRELISALAWRC